MDNCSKRAFMLGEEKTFLRDLVTQKCDIIECKKTDAISVSRKKKAWVEVTNEFNSASENSNRTMGQLKKCWENIKSRRRKELSSEKTYRMATGGGPFKPPTQDGIDSALDKTLDIEIKDTIDSDTVMLQSPSETENGDHNYHAVSEEIVLTEEVHYCEDDRTATEVVPISIPKVTDLKKNSYISRGTAIERELQRRLDRTASLISEDKEIHLLRIEEQRLKIKEQQVKVAIAEEVLKQEQLKTLRLIQE